MITLLQAFSNRRAITCSAALLHFFAVGLLQAAPDKMQESFLTGAKLNGGSPYFLEWGIGSSTDTWLFDVSANPVFTHTESGNFAMIDSQAEVTVEGTVVDANGEPIPGVTVSVSGT